ncbi:hypothetical protein GCM10027034_01950 [Ramlibacter solisilvae]|uniref:Signal peptide prediction n=1 Tax=Ramlibacter tataouinensis TaxID=94132 RepID=A0A127JNX3_9BURK|nr:hypothetical protein [Ramlibacter tataouinensis]AMO21698.1 hypothetical protein UC35_00940 [Ramlibacter tataouinensis]
MSRLLRTLSYAWPAPYTCAGLVFGLLVIAFGGSARVRRGTLEFGGGALGRWIGRSRIPFGAITIGHVVLGLDHLMLDRVRNHEQVHVRQYERWGPLFVPAYLLASAIAWMLGGDLYRDNVFEREAFDKARG